MTDEQLGERLAALGDLIAWPPTPDVAGAVGATIRERASGAVARRTAAVAAQSATDPARARGGAPRARRGRARGSPRDRARRRGRRRAARPSDLAAHARRDARRSRPRDRGGRRGGASPGSRPRSRQRSDRRREHGSTRRRSGSSPATCAVRIVTAWHADGRPRRDPGHAMPAPCSCSSKVSWEVASKQLFAETNRFGDVIVDGREAFWTTGEHELAARVGRRRAAAARHRERPDLAGRRVHVPPRDRASGSARRSASPRRCTRPSISAEPEPSARSGVCRVDGVPTDRRTSMTGARRLATIAVLGDDRGAQPA